MATRVCVGNRQGGVGKSTVTMMLAHALAILGKKRVLVIDLDTQCNSSFAMIGSTRWRKAVKEKVTLADYMSRRLHGHALNPGNFIIKNVGDVSEGGTLTGIDLLPSAIELDEEIQEAIKETRLKDPFNSLNLFVRSLLASLDERYDFILLDCPPGLSPLVNAAVGLPEHRVLIPFRPDYISQFALDRMADKVERTGRRSVPRRQLTDVPHERRRYTSVVNMFGGTPAEKNSLEEYEGVHPRLKTQLKRQPEVAEAFYWQEEPVSLREKYGKAESQVRDLYKDVQEWLKASQPPSAHGVAAE